MNRIEIFTDGACRGNPGKGGWGVMIRANGLEESLYGGDLSTTNNIMELTAAIKALEHIPKNSNVVLTTDSKYVMQGITEWIKNWKIRNWKTAVIAMEMGTVIRGKYTFPKIAELATNVRPVRLKHEEK